MKEIYTPPVLVIHDYDTSTYSSSVESRDNSYVGADEIP